MPALPEDRLLVLDDVTLVVLELGMDAMLRPLNDEAVEALV